MKIANEVKIGLLGVIAIAVFLLGFNYLKGKGLMSSARTVSANYEDVSGLTAANRVTLNGYEVGSVSDIYLEGGNIDKGITVEMSIDKGIKIPKNSSAAIVADGLLGTKAIQLTLGTSKECLDGDGTILGETQVGMMDKVGNQIDPIMKDLKATLASLNESIASINNILTPSTQQNIKNSVATLNSTLNEFNGLAKTLNGQKANVDKVMNNMTGISNSLTGFSNNLSKNNGVINRTLSNLETTSQNFSKLQLEQTVTKLNTTIGSLQSTLNKVNNGKGSMALLTNDAQLYNNIKNTSATLNNLLYDLSARPHRYVNLSLFGGRKKKASPPLNAPNGD